METSAGGFRGPDLSRGMKSHIQQEGGEGRRLAVPGFQLYPCFLGRHGENMVVKVHSADHWPRTGSQVPYSHEGSA